jgi:hypothetical protein
MFLSVICPILDHDLESLPTCTENQKQNQTAQMLMMKDGGYEETKGKEEKKTFNLKLVSLTLGMIDGCEVMCGFSFWFMLLLRSFQSAHFRLQFHMNKTKSKAINQFEMREENPTSVSSRFSLQLLLLFNTLLLIMGILCFEK